jgi:hypothetical protein
MSFHIAYKSHVDLSHELLYTTSLTTILLWLLFHQISYHTLSTTFFPNRSSLTKMAPTILIIGATGNTGRSVVETLPKLLASSSALSRHRVIALTRSLDNPVAQSFAKLPGVVAMEKNWVHITAEWLRKHKVVRAFIAPHTQPNQFPDESTFHLTALKAGVKYIVRISTVTANISPVCDAYYARSY